MIETSPCVGLKPPAANRHRDRVLNDDELRRVWRAAGTIGYPFGPLIQLLVLTAQRRDEVAGLTWDEIDLDSRLWTLPRERAKNDVEHGVPLSGAARAIIEHIPRLKAETRYLFTTTDRSHVTGFSKAKLTIDKVIAADGGAPVPHWTLHDIRRTCATGLARLGVNLPVIERILNHISGPSFGGVAGIYQKHGFADDKKRAMDSWGGYIERLVGDSQTGNIIEMRG